MFDKANDKFNQENVENVENVEKVNEILVKLKSEIEHTKENWLIFLVCFFASRNSIAGELFPCAVSFLCAYYYLKEPSILALAVVIAGVISVKPDVIYVVALIAVYLYFWKMKSIGKSKETDIFHLAAYASGALFLFKLLILGYKGFIIEDLLIIIFEAMFVFSCTLVVCVGIKAFEDKTFRGKETEKNICTLVVIFLFVLGFKGINIYGFEVANAVEFFAVIFAAVFFNPSASIGLCFGFGILEFEQIADKTVYMIGLSVAALFTSALKDKHKIYAGTIFLVVMSFVLIYFKKSVLISANLPELAVVCVLYTAMYFLYDNKIKKYLNIKSKYEKSRRSEKNQIDEKTKIIEMKSLQAEIEASASCTEGSTATKDITYVRPEKKQNSAKHISNDKNCDDIYTEKAKSKIKQYLFNENVQLRHFEVLPEVGGTIIVSATVNTEKSADKASQLMAAAIYNVCGIKMKCSEKLTASSNYHILKFKNIKKIKIKTCYAKTTKDDSDISGDNFTYASRDDKYFAVICDGMGSGIEAYSESKGTVDMLSKLLNTDFTEKQILETLNSLLLLKLGEERYVTFDLLIIDYACKEIRLYKAGASPTFVIREKGTEKIENKSLPMGILENIEYNTFIRPLRRGDILVMMTDGIVDSVSLDEKKSLEKYIETIKNKEPQTIANSILSYAVRGCDEIIDDMTVIVTKIV